MSTSTVSELTGEFLAIMQNVETSEKLMEYCSSASKSTKNVRDGVKTIFAKLLGNVPGEEFSPNPFMIDLVVSSILSNLSQPELLSSRAVCRLWNKEASSILRNTQNSVLLEPNSSSKLEAFIEHAKTQASLNAPPFSIYSFTAPQNPTPTTPKLLFHNFLQHCGSWIKRVELFYPDDGALSPAELTNFLQRLPTLEDIHFVNLPVSLTSSGFLSKEPTTTPGRNNSLPVPRAALSSPIKRLRIDRSFHLQSSWSSEFLQDLLHLMPPTLQEYEVWTWNSSEDEGDHSLPYFLSLSPTNVGSLRTLRPGSIGDRLGKTIAALPGLSLTSLYLPVLNWGIERGTLEGILHSQATSLAHLTLNCSHVKDSKMLAFPRMGHLRSLHLIITHPWTNDSSPNSRINYSKNFPLLKRLRLELAIYNDVRLIGYFFSGEETSGGGHGLEELDVSFSGFRDENFSGNVGRMFPHLRRLRLDGYGNRIFSGIFSSMRHLQVLDLILIYGFNVDDQMTGVGKEVVRQFKNCKSSPMGMQNQLNGLHSLKELRSLSIKQKDYQAKFWPDAQCITDITAYLALSRMKQLRKLQTERVKFSEECKAYLRDTLEDCWLDFT